MKKWMLFIGIIGLSSCATIVKNDTKETDLQRVRLVAAFPGCGKNTRCALPQSISAAGDTKEDVFTYLRFASFRCPITSRELPDQVECQLESGEKTAKFIFSEGKLRKAEFILCHDVLFPSDRAADCLEEGIEKAKELFQWKVASNQASFLETGKVNQVQPRFEVIPVSFAKTVKPEEKSISVENAIKEFTSLLDPLPIGQELIVKPFDEARFSDLFWKMSTLKHFQKDSPLLTVTFSFMVDRP